MKRADALAAQHVVGESGFAFFQNFSHAADGRESGFQRGFQAQVDGVVGFAEVLPALGVADDDVGDAESQQHVGRDLTGERQ